MKKTAAILATALLAMGATAAFATTVPTTGIQGSLHDMTAVSEGGTGTKETMLRVCVYCHTPHGSLSTTTATAPLWNRADGTTLNANSVAYTWASNANKLANGGNLTGANEYNGPTELCLSCHDGSVVVGAHGDGSATGTSAEYSDGTGTSKITGEKKIADFTTLHPIGMDYTVLYGARSGELQPVASKFATAAVTPVVGGGATVVVTPNAKSGPTIADVLYQGKYMTCASCHDVHNKTNDYNYDGDGTKLIDGTKNFFIRASAAGSAICLSCHVK